MSKEIVEKIVLQAKENRAFMEQLLKNPREFLKKYDLTDTELTFFQNADEATLMGLSSACFRLCEKK